LRLGYAVVPELLLAAFATARYLLDRQPPILYQVVAAEFMGQGHFSAHVRRMRLMYREQRDALTATLLRHAGDELEIEVPDQGMHLVAYLTRGKSDVAIEAAAARAGIIARAISRFYRSAPPRAGLMLGFSGFPRRQRDWHGSSPAGDRIAASARLLSFSQKLTPGSGGARCDQVVLQPAYRSTVDERSPTAL